MSRQRQHKPVDPMSIQIAIIEKHILHKEAVVHGLEIELKELRAQRVKMKEQQRRNEIYASTDPAIAYIRDSLRVPDFNIPSRHMGDGIRGIYRQTSLYEMAADQKYDEKDSYYPTQGDYHRAGISPTMAMVLDRFLRTGKREDKEVDTPTRAPSSKSTKKAPARKASQKKTSTKKKASTKKRG